MECRVRRSRRNTFNSYAVTGSIPINRGLILAIPTSLPPQPIGEATKASNLQKIPPEEPQFIYYCERAKLDDIRLTRQINALCDTLTYVIDGRWSFVGELDMLAYKFVPGKMMEFMKEMQDKDIPNLMKLQILGREFELRAREKDLFIEKLKGNMNY
ncbi:hypothetical protein Tco_0010512 [Tanacetum coccineum]